MVGADGLDLNGRPVAYKATALPTELRQHWCQLGALYPQYQPALRRPTAFRTGPNRR